MLPEKQDRAFGEFYKSARYNKILDQKTTLLIHLATAMAAGAVGAGTAAKIGAHAFSWGLSYAYGQALHDVRHDEWLHK